MLHPTGSGGLGIDTLRSRMLCWLCLMEQF